jgi:hypothetical protein
MTSMTRSLINRLDDIANLTGIPQLSDKLARQQQRRRQLRWWPIVALVIATAGMGTLLLPLPFAVTVVAMTCAQVIAGFLPLFGPIKPWGTLEDADERDRQVRRSAFLFCFVMVSAGLFVALPALAALAELYLLPREQIVRILFGLWYYMLILFSTLPTLYASWSSRPIDEE